MKRDWDLIRRILLKIEEKPTLESVVLPRQIQEFNEEIIAYHIWLLKEAGLIEARCLGNRLQRHCLAKNLTWQGHEFLDGIRKDTVWSQVASTIQTKGLDLSFDTIKVAVGVFTREMIGSS